MRSRKPVTAITAFVAAPDVLPDYGAHESVELPQMRVPARSPVLRHACGVANGVRRYQVARHLPSEHAAVRRGTSSPRHLYFVRWTRQAVHLFGERPASHLAHRGTR